MNPETQIVNAIIKAVKQKHPRAYVVKLADRYRRGLPDLLMIVGITFFVETKTATGKLAKIQEAEHRKIRAAGGTVLLARSPKEVLDALEGKI